MDVMAAIRGKRAVRQFSDRPIEDDVLAEILDAGRLAGSAKNMQPWHFIVVRDRERLAALSTYGAYAGHLAGASVGVVLVSVPPEVRWSIMFDLGRAAQNMQLAAWSLGVGSVMATIYEPERARALLGFPEEYTVRAAMSFGYPQSDPGARPPRKSGRRGVDDVIHWERW